MRQLAFVGLILAAPGVAAQSTGSGASAVLARLLEAAHERAIANSLTLQSRYQRPIERLPDVSLAGEEADAAFARALLDTLRTIDRASLSPSEQISAETLPWVLTGTAEAVRFYWLSFASITPYQSPLTGELLFLGRDMPGQPESRRRRNTLTPREE